MEDWQQRVVEELKDLREKTVKLNVFISNDSSFTAVEAYQQVLMRRQRSAMAEYEAVLVERIKAFG